MRPYALLELDGAVIFERCCLWDPHGVGLSPGTPQGLQAMAALGVELVVVTNRSSSGRSYPGESRCDGVNRAYVELPGKRGAALQAISQCPRIPEASPGCSRPAAGGAYGAAAQLGSDLGRRLPWAASLAASAWAGPSAPRPCACARGNRSRVERGGTACSDCTVDDLVAAVPAVCDLCTRAPTRPQSGG